MSWFIFIKFDIKICVLIIMSLFIFIKFDIKITVMTVFHHKKVLHISSISYMNLRTMYIDKLFNLCQHFFLPFYLFFKMLNEPLCHVLFAYV